MDINAKKDIGGFLDYLGLEKGLSDSSLDSYRNDIKKYFGFLEKQGKSIVNIHQSDLTQFLEELRLSGMAPSSIARHLSSLKGFYKYLNKTGVATSNPAETITGPKLYRAHPGALKVEEVLEIINCAKRATTADSSKKRLSLRDLALLEFLYGTGARVSEAAGTKKDDLYPEMGLVKLFGKGKKERVVPMGGAAWRALNDYLESCRPKLVAATSGSYLFLNNRGGKLSRMGIWKILNKYVTAAGVTYSKGTPGI